MTFCLLSCTNIPLCKKGFTLKGENVLQCGENPFRLDQIRYRRDAKPFLTELLYMKVCPFLLKQKTEKKKKKKKKKKKPPEKGNFEVCIV